MPAPTKIDFDGLADRVARVPVPFDNYDGLVAAEGRLLFMKTAPNVMVGEPPSRNALQVFTLKDRKTTTLVEGMNGYALSDDGQKVLVRQDGQYNLYDVNAGGKDSKKTIDTGGMRVNRVPAEEWAEVFREAWRRYRDFFYTENMNGYDWEALRKQYEPLLAYVGHRSDLNYVIGEMIAELNSSHSYVAGGDFKLPPRPDVALPGARFELDKAAGRYRIARIFAGHNDEETYRSPLTEIGVDVHAGDYVLAIDGEELAANDNPYRLLRYKADRPVRMTVNSKPTLDGAREITFRPIPSETDLIYIGWVDGNRERVAKLSNGRLGYIHLPDMGDDGFREFARQYFGQIRKQGLVVDVRNNGGGSISPMLLERLARHPLSVDFARTSDDPQPYPQVTFYGAHGLPAERELGIGRRHLPLHVPRAGAGAADRHPHLGRCGGHHRPRSDDRRRPDLRPRVRVGVAQGPVDHRRARRRSRHRGGERRQVDSRRPRSAARTGSGRGFEKA